MNAKKEHNLYLQLYFMKHNLPVPLATPPAPRLKGSQRACPPAPTYPLPGGETARPRRLRVPPPAAMPGRSAHWRTRRDLARMTVPVTPRAAFAATATAAAAAAATTLSLVIITMLPRGAATILGWTLRTSSLPLVAPCPSYFPRRYRTASCPPSLPVRLVERK